MDNQVNLVERAQRFVKEDNLSGLLPLLSDCVVARSPEGMLAVQLLARDMYGGFSYNWMLKAPAAFCLLAWGKDGLKAIVENALKEPKSKNFSLAFQLLSGTAEGCEPESIASFVSDPHLRQTVSDTVGDWNNLALATRSNLRELMLSIDRDDYAAAYTGTSLLSLSLRGNGAARNLSQALALRCIAVGPRVLAAYDNLLAENAGDETVFQNFFATHPLLLDPRAFQVWGKPDLHGKLEPDFIVRTYDNNYVVVEIETPAKLLLTQQGQLSAHATHAVSQVLQYQEYLRTHWAEAREVFPELSPPTGLVVIGRESSLNAEHRAALRSENLSRRDIRIAGFDALADSAKAATSNVIHGIPETIVDARLP